MRFFLSYFCSLFVDVNARRFWTQMTDINIRRAYLLARLATRLYLTSLFVRVNETKRSHFGCCEQM